MINFSINNYFSIILEDKKEEKINMKMLVIAKTILLKRIFHSVALKYQNYFFFKVNWYFVWSFCQVFAENESKSLKKLFFINNYRQAKLIDTNYH